MASQLLLNPSATPLLSNGFPSTRVRRERAKRCRRPVWFLFPLKSLPNHRSIAATFSRRSMLMSVVFSEAVSRTPLRTEIKNISNSHQSQPQRPHYQSPRHQSASTSVIKCPQDVHTMSSPCHQMSSKSRDRVIKCLQHGINQTDLNPAHPIILIQTSERTHTPARWPQLRQSGPPAGPPRAYSACPSPR